MRFAISNKSRTREAPTPTYISTKSEPEIERKGAPASPATALARRVLPKSDIVFIESNHEIAMVNAGSYPYILKQRILGANGHLSNFACSEYIKELAKSGTTRFVLSHLSRENNLPELARQTAISALSELEMEENKDYRLYVSPPENDARSIVL